MLAERMPTAEEAAPRETDVVPEHGRARPGDVLLVAVITLLARLPRLDRVPEVDELHHVLAARSLIENGSLQIADGDPYTRARAFTYIVAAFFRLFGESLIVARVPALLAGTALVVALYVWLAGVAGRRAAVVGALLFAFYFNGIRLSDLSRFYTLQTLLFWLGAVGTYLIVTRRLEGRHRIAVVAGSVACFAMALHLQIVTVIGIAGVLLWLAGARGPGLWRRIAASPWRGPLVAALALGGAAVIGLVVFSDLGEAAWQLYRRADGWAEADRYNFRFYHWLLLAQYSTLWTLFPLLVVVAAARHWRPATFCATVFTVAFVFHSTAAWKHESYLFYATPMLFAIWGMGLAESYAWIRARIRRLLDRSELSWLRPRIRERLPNLLVAGIVVFAVIGNGASSIVVHHLTGSADRASESTDGDWAAAAATLRPAVDHAAALITSSDLKALYFFDRADFFLLATRLPRSARATAEFQPDRNTGVPVISSPASLERVFACIDSGYVIIENGHWRKEWGVPPAAADYLEGHTEPLAVPRAWRLRVFRWTAPVGAAPPPGECGGLRG